MNRRETIDAYTGLTEQQQVSFLIRLAWELTVQARGTYAAGSLDVTDPTRLRAFNEFQHQLTQHLRHLLDHDSARYPEPVFGEILYESAAELGVTAKLSELLADVSDNKSPKTNVLPKAAGRVA